MWLFDVKGGIVECACIGFAPRCGFSAALAEVRFMFLGGQAMLKTSAYPAF